MGECAAGAHFHFLPYQVVRQLKVRSAEMVGIRVTNDPFERISGP